MMKVKPWVLSLPNASMAKGPQPLLAEDTVRFFVYLNDCCREQEDKLQTGNKF